MSNNDKGAEMTGYVTRGQGAAIHIAKEYRNAAGELLWRGALCDRWNKGTTRPVKAEAATCKSCLKIAASKEA